MKQPVAILIGTLLILPGCAKNETTEKTDTTATGAPAAAQSGTQMDGSASPSDTNTPSAAPSKEPAGQP